MSGKSKGLGDTIAKVTHFFGIDRLSEAVAKLAGMDGCGCEERKEMLNELFPYAEKERLVKVLKEFNISGVDYNKNEVIKVTANHPLYPYIIQLAQDKSIEEIEK